MTADIEIIDPGDYGPGGDPFDAPRASGALPFETRSYGRAPEPDYDDIPEVRPALHQRMSSLSVNDRKSSSKPRRDSALARDNFVYWRIEKQGDDWGYAYRRRLPAPQSEIEKMARKRKGSVLAETRRMGDLRAEHLQRLIKDANKDETGDARWEPVYIESVKVQAASKIKCKSMDVILQRRLPSPKSRSRVRKGSGELIDVVTVVPKNKGEKSKKGDKSEEKKDKEKDEEKEKEKSAKRDSLLDDPFSSTPLFHSSGAPVDDQGVVIDYKDAGLPRDIPPDRPIGAGARDDFKDDKKDKRDKKKRGKSKDRDPLFEPIHDVGDIIADPAPIADLDAILGRPTMVAGVDDGPIAEPGRRSRSRRRSKSTRRRPESISYPPGYGRDMYPGDYSDSASSEESHYGIGLDREELSSRTSQDTYHSIGRRGGHYEGEGGRVKVYREHHRGPSRGADGQRYRYSGPDIYDAKAADSRRRYSRGDYYGEPKPIREPRQIAYREYDSREVIRRPLDDPLPPDTYYRRDRGRRASREAPILHYPAEMEERRAEYYMDASMRDEDLGRRERDVRERERRMDAAETEEWRRAELERELERDDRLREYGGGRRYEGRRYVDDGFRSERGGRYYDE